MADEKDDKDNISLEETTNALLVPKTNDDMEVTKATDVDVMIEEEIMEEEECIDDRIDDMTRSILALDANAEVYSGLDMKRGFSRYRNALNAGKPVRFEKSPEGELPVTTAGCLSLMMYSWLTSIMWNIYKKGITTIDNLRVGDTEKAGPNSARLERLWLAEKKKHGSDAKFIRAVIQFLKTKLLFIIFLLFIMASLSFVGPAFILHRLLSYLNSGDVKVEIGIALVFGLTATELLRSIVFSLTWFHGYTIGVRMRVAMMSMLFKKIMRLRSLENKTIGELVNLISNDGQRIFEAVLLIPLMFPGPVVLLYGLIYNTYLIGPWALMAMGTFGIFYPFMWGISRLTNYYRRKGILITDRRVRLMNEILTCIKLIKMYAWEKSFAKAVARIRGDERKILERGAYVQSVSTATAPMVPVMAGVFTFLGLVLTGHDLTPVEAFTVVAVLNSLRFTLGVLPFSVKALADARSSMDRYRSVLLMDEMEPHQWNIFNDKYAVVVNKATFSWDKAHIASDVSVTASKEMEMKEMSHKANGTTADEEKERLKDADHTNGNATGGSEQLPAIRDATFMVEKGKLIGICGSVGAGKSSLLSAILGRMLRVSGKIALSGSMAYVTQQAWIMNATGRENILFGEKYDEERYNAVLEACALKEDFEDFVAGDMTEIGERGLNMSGGQKQRISLARAVYSNSDIYLLDDPLSAVDIHSGRHIFSECLAKLLKGKTVLFVTHQLQYLSQCDSILVIRDGMIAESGTHPQLMASQGEYATLIKIFYTKEKEKEASKENVGLIRQLSKQASVDQGRLMRQRTLSSGSSHSGGDCSPKVARAGQKRDLLKQMSVLSKSMSIDEPDKKPLGGKLIVAEERKEGTVGWSVYSGYMKSGGGFFVSFLVILSFILSIGSQTMTNWWLSYWLNQGSGNTTIIVNNQTMISRSITDNPDLHFYTLVYGMGVVAMLVTTISRSFIFMKVSLRASSTMHNDIFSKMLRSSMTFFDTTPVGRIINKFSTDMDEVDVRLPMTAELFIQNILMIVTALGIISYVSPWFLIALLPGIICFIVLNKLFTSGIRELKRMMAITTSPLLSHMTASVQGISTVHAYGKSEHFINKFEALLDKNTVYFYLFVCANRWLAVRLDFLSTFLVCVAGISVVLTYDTLTPAMAGLALSFAIQITGLFQFTIRQAIETEAKFVAVERIQFYAKDSKIEAPDIIKDHRPPVEWPKHGEIKYSKYKMRYREGLPLALKGIGFTVRAQEKIGIVGRSGSGKSSLGVALFRLVEPASGTILIDGVDITSIGLEDLRSHLAIIPQDPVLFAGTVRYNLDPFDVYTDDALWEALEKCHVKDTISSLELQLQQLVVENGENFSVGERQLICMARALLRHSKILMLDEATAAIDTETDALVQRTIKEAFHDCTMLVIAHRLNTVLSCDRILVMEDGEVVEYGKPSDLLASSKSKFKAMLDAVDEQHDMLS